MTDTSFTDRFLLAASRLEQVVDWKGKDAITYGDVLAVSAEWTVTLPTGGYDAVDLTRLSSALVDLFREVHTP